MRNLLAVLMLCGALSATAQDKPANLQPVPEPPAPAAGFDLDPTLEPQITIRKRGPDTVEEYRVGGKLYMIKVTPAHGRPYFLIDERGDGRMTRQDSMDSGIRVPMWVIHSW